MFSPFAMTSSAMALIAGSRTTRATVGLSCCVSAAAARCGWRVSFSAWTLRLWSLAIETSPASTRKTRATVTSERMGFPSRVYARRMKGAGPLRQSRKGNHADALPFRPGLGELPLRHAPGCCMGQATRHAGPLRTASARYVDGVHPPGKGFCRARSIAKCM